MKIQCGHILCRFPAHARDRQPGSIVNPISRSQLIRRLRREPGPDAAGVYTDSERSSVTKSAGCWSGLVMLTAE